MTHLRAGRVRQLGGATSDSRDIEELDGKSYCYLGVEQGNKGQSSPGVPAEWPCSMEFLPLSCSKG